jgi:hypothetical protein
MMECNVLLMEWLGGAGYILSQNITWLERKLYIYCCVKLNFKKELCFVVSAYSDIIGVW